MAQGRHAYFDLPRPVVLGHRGAAAHAPENTLLSFERALALGADIIESDVQVTRDGVPVLIHDGVLGRATSGSGPVDALILAEVREVDAGHHFSLGERGDVMSNADDPDATFRGRGLHIPTLEEAFAALPDARFNLEIKTRANHVVAHVLEQVAKHGREGRTLLTAGDDATMAELRSEIGRSGTQVATSASLADIVAVVRSAVDGTAPPAEVMALQIPTVFGGNDLVTPRLLEHTHAHGIHVHVWTINDEAEMERLLDLGVDGLVTDFPDRAAAVIAPRRVRA